MILQHTNSNLDGQFILTRDASHFNWRKAHEDNLIHILWNHSDADVGLEIDGRPVTLPPESVITATFYHRVSIHSNAAALVIFSFNRQYYCIYDHDAEISCNGIIFFGAQQQTVITLDDIHRRKLKLLLEVFIDEFMVKDNVQGEMLVMLLKRLIIICTRLAKRRTGLDGMQYNDVDIVREFHFLVDINFKTIKTVKEYAGLMHKSPKTLANLFAKLGAKTPLQIIHERVILEARRLLTYTDKTVNEIAFDLGFEEPATFFKLFKKHLGESPQNFRAQQKSAAAGNLAT